MLPPYLDPVGKDEAHLVYLSMSAGSIHCLDSGLLAASVACLACTAFNLSTSLFLQLTGVRLATSTGNPVPGALQVSAALERTDVQRAQSAGRAA